MSYIGSHVAKQLLEFGQDIVVVGNLSTGFQSTIDTLQKIKKFDFVKLDLKEFDEVLAGGIEWVLNASNYKELCANAREKK